MEFKSKTILVIAHKYNDIIYAISTPEFKKAINRKLIILGDQEKYKNFPFLYFFQEIVYVKYKFSTINILIDLFRICANRKKIKCDCVFFVNPLLVIDQYIFRKSKAEACIWVEDGLMNYDPKSKSSSLLKSGFCSSLGKKMIQKILRVSNNLFPQYTLCTYLLCPLKATWFYGEKKQLVIDVEIVDLSVFSYIKGKKIFIGQNLYPQFCSIEQYCKLVNIVIEKYDIDYYVPHLCSSEKEKINANIIDLSKTQFTFEVISAYLSFSIYSFGSSLLYTTKQINSSIISNLIKVPFYDVSNFDVISSTVDYVWELEKNKNK